MDLDIVQKQKNVGKNMWGGGVGSPLNIKALLYIWHKNVLHALWQDRYVVPGGHDTCTHHNTQDVSVVGHVHSIRRQVRSWHPGR